jgi:hypothetical protein
MPARAQSSQTACAVVLRLMGLPPTSRCPDVSVRRRPATLELRFSGPDCDHAFDVDGRLLGAGADLEIEELTLLAELERRGYRVRRLDPADE